MIVTPYRVLTGSSESKIAIVAKIKLQLNTFVQKFRTMAHDHLLRFQNFDRRSACGINLRQFILNVIDHINFTNLDIRNMPALFHSFKIADNNYKVFLLCALTAFVYSS